MYVVALWWLACNLPQVSSMFALMLLLIAKHTLSVCCCYMVDVTKSAKQIKDLLAEKILLIAKHTLYVCS